MQFIPAIGTCLAYTYRISWVWYLAMLALCLSCQAGMGGELTRDETLIIGGALDLTQKVMA